MIERPYLEKPQQTLARDFEKIPETNASNNEEAVNETHLPHMLHDVIAGTK